MSPTLDRSKVNSIVLPGSSFLISNSNGGTLLPLPSSGIVGGLTMDDDLDTATLRMFSDSCQWTPCEESKIMWKWRKVFNGNDTYYRGQQHLTTLLVIN